MSDEIIDVQLVEERMVTCPNCGQRNRVHKHERQVRFRCGACKTELSNPFAVARFSPKSIFASLRSFSPPKRRKAVLLFGILALVGIAFFLAIFHVHGTRWGPRPLTTQEVQDILANQRRSMMELKNDLISNHPSMPTSQPLQSLPPPRSLSNGAVLTPPLMVGEGTLTIDNGTTHDAVVKLIDERAQRLIVAFYVRAGRKASVKTIPDGLFRVIFGSGTDWDSAAGTFTRDKSFELFDKELDFGTTQQLRGDNIYEQYSFVSLTLHGVINGNATTSHVPETEFLKY